MLSSIQQFWMIGCPILIGLIIGFIYFILIRPIEFKDSHPYRKFIAYNLLFIFVGIPIGYILCDNLFNVVSLMSSLQTNASFVLFTSINCIASSLIIFGLIKFPNYSDCLNNSVFSPISFFLDLNFYLFLLNAFLISAYYNNSLSCFILTLFGFSISLLFLNVKHSLMMSKQIY